MRVRVLLPLLLLDTLALADPHPPLVIFSVENDLDGASGSAMGLLPLACYDPTRGVVSGGAGCLVLLPTRAKVATADGTLRTSGPRRVVCALNGKKLPGIGVTDRSAARVNGRLAMWPRFEVRSLARREPSAVDVAALRTLVADARGDHPAHERLVVIGWSGDLDGDGVEVRLWAVAIGRGYDDEGTRVGALVLARGTAPPVILVRETGTAFDLAGVVDLDGDGHVELVITRALFEGSKTSVERVNGDRLERIGGGAYCGT